MSFSTIRLSTDARGVATLTLARPERHNALSAAMIAEISEATRLLAENAGVRAVVLAAEGESFCAGGDLEWMRAQFDASREQRIAEARKLAHMLRALQNLPQPLIGRVQGAAYGGGVGMVSVCDVAVAAAGARFALTETRLGLIPATVGPYVVARLGHANARRVFMSARLFGAEEAKGLGLVHEVVEPAALDAAIAAEIAPYLAAAPAAVAAAKAMLHRLGPRIDESVIETTIAALADAWETPEAHEGVAAFFEKRPPGWRV